ncbi:MAG TPA: GDSL-type esterase/lipase family protein, partial [Limnobacter sp.]|nr:GDSL-type esterase/lipase family protein [Limnobacter sp.]
MAPTTTRLAMAFCLASLLIACGGEDTTQAGTRVNAQANDKALVGAWATAPYGPYPLGPLTRDGAPTPGAPEVAQFPGNQANNQSFRMIIHPTIGGDAVRVRLSNLMGDRPVRFENISIAKGNPLTPNIDASTQTPLTVGGKRFGVAPAGAELLTDVVAFDYEAGDDLAVSFHVAGESGPMTWHAVSFATQFIAPPDSGDQTQDATGTAVRQVSVGWFFISGLDVINPQAKGAMVAIGDSITDGAYQALNQRWPDFLAQRLQAAGQTIGVLNQGINSNTVTDVRDGAAGPPLVKRFQRDVLSRSGVKSVLILEGTNDLGAGVDAPEIIEGLKTVI